MNTGYVGLTSSMEDYLETIFQTIARKEAVRPKDIARSLKVSNASVTGALRTLSDKNMINYSPHDVITLTPEGRKAALDVIRRHEVLRDFFVKILSVPENEADQAACRMEHSVPPVVFERLVCFAEFFERCPASFTAWISSSCEKCEHGVFKERCEKCLSAILDEVKDANRRGCAPGRRARLGDMKAGEKGKVLALRNTGDSRRRLVEMGVISGAVVEIERVAPLGDPFDIKVRGYHLSLRKDEAAKIEVEKL